MAASVRLVGVVVFSVGAVAVAAEVVEALFKAGLADPRDCEYRAVTVTTRPQGRGAVETHAWVIADRFREMRRTPFAICWNGQV